jgi:hypothetical protein
MVELFFNSSYTSKKYIKILIKKNLLHDSKPSDNSRIVENSASCLALRVKLLRKKNQKNYITPTF